MVARMPKPSVRPASPEPSGDWVDDSTSSSPEGSADHRSASPRSPGHPIHEEPEEYPAEESPPSTPTSDKAEDDQEVEEIPRDDHDDFMAFGAPSWYDHTGHESEESRFEELPEDDDHRLELQTESVPPSPPLTAIHAPADSPFARPDSPKRPATPAHLPKNEGGDHAVPNGFAAERMPTHPHVHFAGPTLADRHETRSAVGDAPATPEEAAPATFHSRTEVFASFPQPTTSISSNGARSIAVAAGAAGSQESSGFGRSGLDPTSMPTGDAARAQALPVPHAAIYYEQDGPSMLYPPGPGPQAAYPPPPGAGYESAQSLPQVGRAPYTQPLPVAAPPGFATGYGPPPPFNSVQQSWSGPYNPPYGPTPYPYYAPPTFGPYHGVPPPLPPSMAPLHRGHRAPPLQPPLTSVGLAMNGPRYLSGQGQFEPHPPSPAATHSAGKGVAIASVYQVRPEIWHKLAENIWAYQSLSRWTSVALQDEDLWTDQEDVDEAHFGSSSPDAHLSYDEWVQASGHLLNALLDIDPNVAAVFHNHFSAIKHRYTLLWWPFLRAYDMRVRLMQPDAAGDALLKFDHRLFASVMIENLVGTRHVQRHAQAPLSLNVASPSTDVHSSQAKPSSTVAVGSIEPRPSRDVSSSQGGQTALDREATGGEPLSHHTTRPSVAAGRESQRLSPNAQAAVVPLTSVGPSSPLADLSLSAPPSPSNELGDFLDLIYSGLGSSEVVRALRKAGVVKSTQLAELTYLGGSALQDLFSLSSARDGDGITPFQQVVLIQGLRRKFNGGFGVALVRSELVTALPE